MPRPKKVPGLDVVGETMQDPAALLIPLVIKCLDVKATSADVGRLYKARDSILQMNWDSQESLDLKSKLVACFESRVFYKSPTGVNFLVLVFNLHPFLIPPISETLKRIILVFPPPLVQACSQVLFKAWQSSSGGMRIALEQSIMEWMRKALYTCTKTAERVRFLLSEIHSATRTKEIDEMLSRYYGPILFRHTKVANWEVRFNAVALVCAAFPIIPPDTTQIQFEEKLTTQFRVLKDSMEDPNESVRKCAVVGAGRILRDFWEVLSIEQIAIVLDCVSQKAAKDKNSVKTRIASIDSLSLIIDNPLSHGVLMELLPDTRQLLNDESPFVRFKFVSFLSKLTKYRTISIPRIVDQSVIFSRLVEEHTQSLHNPNPVVYNEISKQLASIMAPSLFSGSIEDQVSKSERMAESIPQGFLALVAWCSSVTPELDRVRLAVVISTRAITIAAKHAGKDRKGFVARILLRAATELFRSSQFANVQDSETFFKKDTDEGKLSGFIYRHVIDRDIARFLDSCVESRNVIIPELMDWLSVLDGCRLPLTYTKLETYSRSPDLVEVTRRVCSSWGIYLTTSDSEDGWKVVHEAVRSGQASGNHEQAIDVVLGGLLTALSLMDDKPLIKHRQDIVSFIHSISPKLLNSRFIPRVCDLLKLSLASLLRLHQVTDAKRSAGGGSRRTTEATSELSAVLYKFNVGLISSLTTTPLPPRPVLAKKQRTGSSNNNSEGQVEMALGPPEMVDVLIFYLDFLLVSSLLTGIALKATKFDELCVVLFQWIDRDIFTDPGLWGRLSSLVEACVEAKQGPWAACALLEGIFRRIPSETESAIRLVEGAIRNFGFTSEFSHIVSKMGIAKSNEGLRDLIRQSARAMPELVAQNIIQ